jgi:putative nucleotidyltransferase with HDIG domain
MTPPPGPTSQARHEIEVRARELAQEGREAEARGALCDSLAKLEEAHRLLPEHEPTALRVDVLRWLGTTLRELGRTTGAEAYYTESRALDRYTQGHCERVAAYACALATASGMDTAHLRWFRMGALLHDVGKIVVPSSILNKPGRLTTEEWAIMKRHPQAGVHLLREIEFPWDIRPMVRHHHEHWDGGGYPDGLSGDDIPLSARILCLADVFDALTSDRSYRAGLAPAEALSIMADDCGRIFDPTLFKTFSGLHSPRPRSWKNRSLTDRRAQSPDPNYRYPAAWSVNSSA